MSADEIYVHPKALCESEDVGSGTRVWAFAHVMPGASIGAGCNIGGSCFVEDGAVLGSGVTLKNGVAVWRGVTIEDDVFIGPNVVFTNDLRPRAEVKLDVAELRPTLVRRGATIGANATVVCDTTIGSYAFVGAGAVVILDVPDHGLVVGNPARSIGWACRCGLRLPSSLSCTCGRSYVTSDRGLRRA